MRVDCEARSEACTNHIEISDIIDPKSMDELKQALQELSEAGWSYVLDPANLYIYCPEHKVLATAANAMLDALNKEE